MAVRRIAIIGFGKIAADQHAPAIAADPKFELVASVSRSGTGPEPKFTSHLDMLKAIPELDAVAITTSPGPRYQIARDCIAAGLDVLLEKPPTVTLGEIEDLAAFAKAKRVVLFATWHARHNPAVIAAADLLAGKRVKAMRIVWHEDVEKWHPGQQWIWDPGGFGVFDPGINALSIATRIFPGALVVSGAELTYRGDAQTPIAAELVFASPAADAPMSGSFDWRRTEGEEWTITIETADGMTVELVDGGSKLIVDGEAHAAPGIGEYPDIYRRFGELVAKRESEVDVSPLRLVADALLIGRRVAEASG